MIDYLLGKLKKKLSDNQIRSNTYTAQTFDILSGSICTFIFQMSSTSSKIYEIGNHPLQVNFMDKVVSLDFTPYHREGELLKLYQSSSHLVKLIKIDYLNIYNTELKIRNASFVAEIWGHLVAYRISLWLKRHIKIGLIQKLAKFTAFRSGVIDCGEGSIDTNRWFWDILARLFFRKYK